MSEESLVCTCSETGYDRNCPKAFVQNGQVLHVLDPGDRLKPVTYQKQLSSQSMQASNNHKDNESALDQDDGITSSYAGVFSDEIERQKTAEHQIMMSLGRTNQFSITKGRFTNQNPEKAKWVNEENMMSNNRDFLGKFQALKIGNETLPKMTIGGYKVDLDKALAMAKKVIPLPPSMLPIIFVDPELNFLHHFFQGLEIAIGRNVLIDMVSCGTYDQSGKDIVFGLIKEMISEGYTQTDTEITVFAKKVLGATFEFGNDGFMNKENNFLSVAANLYGFQYIECGMQCKEPDLRMWLSISYSHYRTVWFNTFKCAGIPAFAMEGVQTRYSSEDKKTTIMKERYGSTPEYENPNHSKYKNHQKSSGVYGKKSHRSAKSNMSFF